jgi:hypothetical protein
MAKKTLGYLSLDCRLTLREGIQELRQAEAAANVAPELSHDLDVHDAIHVLFGCPTSLAGEVIAHVWTVFGTTSKLGDLHRVTSHEDHREVLAEIGHFRLLRKWLLSLPRILGTVGRARRMRRRWPVEEFPSFLDRPLDEIRREFGIRFNPPSAPTHTPRQPGAALRNVKGRTRGTAPAAEVGC